MALMTRDGYDRYVSAQRPCVGGAVRRRAAVVMWAGIFGSALLLLLLLARGWGSGAWALAAGVLLVTCLGVCVGAAVLGRQSARAIDDAVARLADERRARVHTPNTGIGRDAPESRSRGESRR